jgi:hypothetical protein
MEDRERNIVWEGCIIVRVYDEVIHLTAIRVMGELFFACELLNAAVALMATIPLLGFLELFIIVTFLLLLLLLLILIAICFCFRFLGYITGIDGLGCV